MGRRSRKKSSGFSRELRRKSQRTPEGNSEELLKELSRSTWRDSRATAGEIHEDLLETFLRVSFRRRNFVGNSYSKFLESTCRKSLETPGEISGELPNEFKRNSKRNFRRTLENNPKGTIVKISKISWKYL